MSMKVTSLAIITAQNPQGLQLPFGKNYDLNRKLRLELKEANYHLLEIPGRYGGKEENSFLIVNIPRKKIMQLTEKYKQAAAV